MRRWILVTLPLLFMFSTAFAQVHDRDEMRAEVNFAMGTPQGDFGDRLERDVFGLTVFIGGPVPQSPVVLGSEIGFVNYGTASRLSIHSTTIDDGIDRDLAIPLEALNVEATSNMLLGHLVARLQPFEGHFQPYVDVLAGLRYFTTRVNVESDVVIFRRGLSQDSYITDLAFSYGAGGGLAFLLHEQASAWSKRPATISLHGGLRYLFGTEAEYVENASFQEVNNQIVFGMGKSRTDMLVYVFGLRVRH